MSDIVTVGKIEMKSILPRLQEWWTDYESDDFTLEGKIDIACVIGERGGRIIVELEALHAQVEQAKAENARLRETLKALFDKIETNEDGWARLGQKAYAAFFTYEKVAALHSIVFEAAQ